MHFKNFIDCVRSGKWQDLNADILEGHLSTTLCHLGNIACRLKRTLQFDPNSEKFIDDDRSRWLPDKNVQGTIFIAGESLRHSSFGSKSECNKIF